MWYTCNFRESKSQFQLESFRSGIDQVMTISPGRRIGPYEVLSPLGAGGMGEVYRARDTKLNRDAALKVLPEILARDPERMARFKREAQVLASLNHPNIATIYGFEESDGVSALAMELVEGPTLAEQMAVDRLRVGEGTALPREREALAYHSLAGPIPLDECLPIAKQIADALEYAHERGIIHRDLKPANIKVTPQGVVKILDFGLAKALEGDSASSASNLMNSPTLTAAATQAGVIIGTAAYMSPEQARGRAADRRADIWSFGCVLYEVLAGKRLFDGETVSDTLAAILKSEPDWGTLPSSTPPRIRELLRRCLTKDPRQRLRDIGEARIAIEEAMSGVGAEGVRPGEVGLSGMPPMEIERRSPLRRALPWVVGLIVGAVAAGLAVWRLSAPAAPAAAMRFSAVTNFPGVQSQPAFSPDGRSIAFVSNRDGDYNIYVGLVRGGNLVQITHDSNLESRPAWSPDGATLAYARLNESGIWDIWEIPALGGTPRRVTLNASDPDYSRDGHSLAYANSSDGAIWVSGVSGENARQVAKSAGPGWHDAEPRFSPDGSHIAFASCANGPYAELRVVDLASGKVRQLTRDDALARSPAWSPDGRSIYFASSRGGAMNIWKIPATGDSPEQITAGQSEDAQLDVSSDGKRIVFSTWHENVNIAQLDLQANPGQRGLKTLTTDPVRNQVAPAYSPDGKRLVYFSNLNGVENENIWVSNSDGSNPLLLVQDSRINVFPHWTPDSRHIVYCSESKAESPDEYRSVSVSGGAPQTILSSVVDRWFDVGRDGRMLFRKAGDQVEAFDPRNGKTESLGTIHGAENVKPARWSPDERSIAYSVSASKEDDLRAGLWVDDFKNPPRQVFRGWVIWYARGPGNEIYLAEGKPDLKSVMWKVGWDGKGLTRTSATILMIHSYWVDPARNTQDEFDMSPDGRHIALDMQTVLGANIGMIENVR